MSRALPRNGTPARRPGEEDDICPVCKSSRYLNPNMRFLVNPECYHKMCESCVDRIFSQGPAPCPVAGCARTLRKQRFRKQTFDDIHIEREVDIRRRVAQVFNRLPSDFTSLLAYNNYLEHTETLTFNLLNNNDVPATERILSTHAAQNAAAIARNAALLGQESTRAEAQRGAQRDAARARREEARREEEEERRGREQEKRELVEKIRESKDDTELNAIVAQDEQQQQQKKKVVELKRSTTRREKAARSAVATPGDAFLPPGHSPFTDEGADPSLYTIQGLKPVVTPEPVAPYDPFGGISVARVYHSVRDDGYEHPWLERARTDVAMVAGGYDLAEYCARAMLEAFAGLGCFVGEGVGGAGKEVGGDARAGDEVGGGKR